MFSPFPWHCFLFSPFSSVLKSSILQDIVPQDQTMPVYDLFYHISALPGTILFLFFSLLLNFVYISILIKKLLWLSSSCSCSFPETSLNRSIAFCSNAFAFFTSFSSHMSLERPLSQSETSFFKRLITICICAGVFADAICLALFPSLTATLPERFSLSGSASGASDDRTS